MSSQTNLPRVAIFEQDSGTGYHIFSRDSNGVERKAIGFFGNRLSLSARLETEFPELKFTSVRQTHSDRLVRSPFVGEPPEADAQWTREINLAIGIRTADCVPVLIFDFENSIAMAIHAGWRGVENEIICKSIAALGSEGFRALSQNTIALIGPHIMHASFEVGLDVAGRLRTTYLRSAPNDIHPAFKIETVGATLKTHVDLDAIVCAQLVASGISFERQTWLAVDTVVSTEHESFRRDRDQSGRQISFAAFLK